MLKIKDVTLAFGKNVVLDDVNLEFKQGEIVGLVAPNGTGKSTLINVILHNLTPQKGFVEYENTRYQTQKDTIKLHQEICSFPAQSDLFPFMTGRDHLNLYADLWHNSEKPVEQIITDLQMENYVEKKVQTYSLGMKQRLCFAMVVAADSPVMLLDEVMNGLDPQNVALISQMLLKLKDENKLIIMASHLLSNLQQYADRVLFMGKGHIIEDLDNKKQNKRYLKMQTTPETTKLLAGYDYETLPNNLILVPLEKIEQDKLTQLIASLVRADIQYAVERIDIEDLFNKFYD
ncbi:ABC transporter ATP-binding protein [uncultured Lactobacillus sp.]|uniref:ABC transporter ATP-binding protein n=1 Tax=uncultured Lactobacillus sp. TaxID=153152 RepID=UPI0025E2D73A|nr:ABC transporter ATP-binding protein [uncultured Lactobacillus sp.]